MDGDKSLELNRIWEKRIKESGADFVCFVDISSLPQDAAAGFPCAVIFGKALSKDYIRAIRDNRKPATKEIFNTERKMDTLAEKLCGWLENDGYRSIAKLKTGRLPHKTVALLAGLGFIGKNNLLVTEKYGCALMLGKVLTEAPFVAESHTPPPPQCSDCRVCINACKPGALLGKIWSVETTRDEILTRKLCNLCHKCMVFCPYTAEYIK